MRAVRGWRDTERPPDTRRHPAKRRDVDQLRPRRSDPGHCRLRQSSVPPGRSRARPRWDHRRVSRADTVRFRHSQAILVAAIVAFIGALPLANARWYLLPVLLSRWRSACGPGGPAPTPTRASCGCGR